MITYFKGAFTPLEDVSVSPFDRGFLFADGVYESIRIYNNKLFKYDEHLTRLKRSLNELLINYKSVEQLESIIYNLIKLNDLQKTEARYRSNLKEAQAELERVKQQGASRINQSTSHAEIEKRKLGLSEFKLNRMQEQMEATKIYAEAYGLDPDFYSFVKTLDIYKDTLDEGSSLVLSTDSEFLKYLKGPTGKR